MAEMTRSRVRATSTTKTYAYCRIAASRALKHAKKAETGSLYFNMMAATFAAFTVEGFLNHIGETKVPEWETLERRLGPREKVLLLRNLLHLTCDESRRPFQTLRTMLRVRDGLAHGRTIKESCDRTVRRVTEQDEQPGPEWKRLCAPMSVQRMVEDAEGMVRNLSSQIWPKIDPFAFLGSAWSNVERVSGPSNKGMQRIAKRPGSR